MTQLFALIVVHPMLDDPKTCNHDYLAEKRRVTGYIRIFIDENGEEIDQEYSGRRLGPMPKVVECQNCGKRLPNPRLKK